MKDYFSTATIDTTDFTDQNVNQLYAQGFLFTRRAKGNLYQTRSLRVNLADFELTSENRRILKKNEALALDVKTLPLNDYTWQIHKLGKDFYSQKFGNGTMSATKIKELFQEPTKSNMTHVLIYSIDGKEIGYCMAYTNQEIIHYAYPFYDLTLPKEQSIGLAMMTKALNWAKENGIRYAYLGSVTTPNALYKLQFSGSEWWDNETKSWSTDLGQLKKIVTDHQ